MLFGRYAVEFNDRSREANPGYEFHPRGNGDEKCSSPGIPGDELYANVLHLLCRLISSRDQAAGLQN